jgi:hypothetical protein
MACLNSHANQILGARRFRFITPDLDVGGDKTKYMVGPEQEGEYSLFSMSLSYIFISEVKVSFGQFTLPLTQPGELEEIFLNPFLNPFDVAFTMITQYLLLPTGSPTGLKEDISRNQNNKGLDANVVNKEVMELPSSANNPTPAKGGKGRTIVYHPSRGLTTPRRRTRDRLVIYSANSHKPKYVA